MSDRAYNDMTRSLPQRFPTWPGILAALVVAGALAGVEAAGLFPPPLAGVAGQVMIAAHALVALAAVTLLGEAARVSGRARELNACQNEPDDRRDGWPVDALDDALSRLYVRHSTAELRSEVVKTADRIFDRQQWTWRLGQAVCFLVPAVGFAAALWALKKEGNTVPWRETGLPLLLALAETLPVILLAVGVRSAVRSLVQEWRLFAEALAVERRPPGQIPNPNDLDEAELDTEGGWPGTRRRAPAPEPVEPPPPPPPPRDRGGPTRGSAPRPEPGSGSRATRPTPTRPAPGPHDDPDPDTSVPPTRGTPPPRETPGRGTPPPRREPPRTGGSTGAGPQPADKPTPPPSRPKPEPKTEPPPDPRKKADESERWY